MERSKIRNLLTGVTICGNTMKSSHLYSNDHTPSRSTHDLTKAPETGLDPTTSASRPGRPTVSGVRPTSATVAWAASTDDGGVRAYLVRDQGGTVLQTVTGTPPATTATVPLECDHTDQLDVVARDTAGRLSTPSAASASFTTGACGTVPQPPTTVASGWDVPWNVSWAPGRSFALVTERDTFRVYKLTAGGAKTQVGTVPDVQTHGRRGRPRRSTRTSTARTAGCARWRRCRTRAPSGSAPPTPTTTAAARRT